jgi:hypothetical protein
MTGDKLVRGLCLRRTMTQIKCSYLGHKIRSLRNRVESRASERSMMEHPPALIETVNFGEERWNCAPESRSIGRWESDSSLQDESQCRPPRRPNKHRSNGPDHSRCCGCNSDPRWIDRSIINSSSASCPLMPVRRKSFMEYRIDCPNASSLFQRSYHSHKSFGIERPKIRAAYSA